MSTNDRVRLGFIGAGDICRQRHLPGVRKIDGVELVAVCNRSQESSRRVQAEWGFERIAGDWREIVEARDIDAVFIGTWPYRHCEMSVAALKAGKHVFCQARMCMDWNEAVTMRAAAAERPRQVAMICPSPHRVRWERTVKAVLASKEFGDLHSVAVISNSGANRDPNAVTWRERVELSGLNVLQVGIFAETLNAWCGEYESLAAATAIPLREKRDASGGIVRIEIPQIVSITGTLAGGVIATEQHSGLAAGSDRSEIVLYGSGATCKIDLLSQQVLLSQSGQQPAERVIDDPGDPWKVEEEFIEAARSARRGEQWRVRPDFPEAARYMRKLQAIHDSARAGQVVRLAEIQPGP
jgi:predicted dehydrogenase